MNVPNILTIARVCAIPFFVWVLMENNYLFAMIIFIVAAATDALDGHIARKYNLVSNFGKIMDPLADKLLVMAALVCLTALAAIPAWMTIVILAREFTISGLRAVAAAEGIVIAAGMTGKIKTVLQMVALPVIMLVRSNQFEALLTNYGYLDNLYIFAIVLLWAAVIMTIVSGAEYIVKNIQVFKQ
ncbi:MAG: CDP-diacylglycerol--glycerol-3-phosphate 3-phosphatidyltransferase [Anaerovoracaceae bacterium]